VLRELGFQRQGTRNPFPEDGPMRVGSIGRDGDTCGLHVHVVPADSGEPDEIRAFRDSLRANPEMMEAYVQRKRDSIVGGTTDALDYSKAKVRSSGKRWSNGAARTERPRAQISRGVLARKRA
jgi:GrpB-like predicted nucleotidyltransferase (UPF0157 family)